MTRWLAEAHRGTLATMSIKVISVLLNPRPLVLLLLTPTDTCVQVSPLSHDPPSCAIYTTLHGKLADERAASIGLSQPDRAEWICGGIQQRSCAGRSVQAEIRCAAVRPR